MKRAVSLPFRLLARFSKIHMTVSAEYQDRELMEQLLVIAERSCIAANTLCDAVELSVSLEESVMPG